jgi:hypothetical protein
MVVHSRMAKKPPVLAEPVDEESSITIRLVSADQEFEVFT